MNNRALLPVFAATLLISAFLIFSVQPLLGKMLLPVLGGSPSVWNTAMVFFQGMLLAGYIYAHAMARYVPLKMQGILHIILLCAFAFILPLALPADLSPPAESGQAWWQLVIMAGCVGGPFFILAASAPLFLHWFSATGHDDAQNPYFLYAVSNAGSMIALLSYPFVIEPHLSILHQTWAWAGGYGALIILTILCALLARNGQKPVSALGSVHDKSELTWRSCGAWIGLAFIPSSLMLGVTTLVTTDLASIPFLWIIPLTLYLATFIIAFSRKPVIDVAQARTFAAYSLCFVVCAFMMLPFILFRLPVIGLHLFAFFACALLCHGELARLKPSASNLTQYFLLIALGGVLGGIFNALLAPQIFLVPLEYSLALAMVAFVIWAGAEKIPALHGTFNAIDHKHRPMKLMIIDIATIVAGAGLFLFVLFSNNAALQMLGALGITAFLILMVPNRFVFAMTATMALFIFQSNTWSLDQKPLALDRNYFGALKVFEKGQAHHLYHGTTLHGSQLQMEEYKKLPSTYYIHGGPLSDVFAVMDKRKGSQKIAAMGLGVGSVACYAAPDRFFDFYEIDRDVVKIAQNPEYFSYLSDCNSPYNIILGDARLKIAQAPDASYDLIFIDTFSSDAIPTHIITEEAFRLYQTKLKQGGIITINISNRYFDLEPALDAMAKELGLTVYFKSYIPKKTGTPVDLLHAHSVYAVIGATATDIAPFVENYAWKPYAGENNFRPWTDDYANIFATLRNVSR